ncbi:MAG: PfkB family carbohydrate kinase [Verrucomicrobiota bacterium]
MAASIDPSSLASRFAEQRILVVGDIMLDWFIWGSVSRISPEAPVPVVEVQRESRYPGGAANVARNLTPFEGNVALCGLQGRDANGSLLTATLEENAIQSDLCLILDEFPTISKTRVVARQQQVVRIDREKKFRLSDSQEDQLIQSIAEQIDQFDGMIIEDYGKGLITPRFAAKLLDLASRSDLVVTVDPNPKNPITWRGATTIKPNRPEAFASARIEDENRDAGVPPLEDKPLLQVGEQLLKDWDCQSVLITLGEQGMLLFSESATPFLIPAHAKEVFDVSGAGDTAIAIYTLALCAGLSMQDAVRVSNRASSLVVAKLGTAPVERDELLHAIQQEFAS